MVIASADGREHGPETDNGVDVPASFDRHNTGGLRLALVNRLAQLLEGTSNMNPGRRTEIRIEFSKPMPAKRERALPRWGPTHRR